jgi:hypothetical protein
MRENFLGVENHYSKPEFGIVALRRIWKHLRDRTEGGAVNLYGFKDIYEPREINEDARKVDECKKRFAEELDGQKSGNQETRHSAETAEYNKTLSEIMKAAIIEFGETSNWFGEDAYLNKTSEYDDLFNGVDMVLVFGEDSEAPIALTIDVTSAADLSVLGQKMEKTKQRALSRRSDRRTVKYYESPIDGEKHKGIETVPVVVGFSKENVEKMISAINSLMTLENAEAKSSANRAKIKEIKQKLSEHPMQMNMLKEILVQLNSYIKEMGESKNAYTEKINFLRDKIQQIVNEKESDGLLADENDKVFCKIISYYEKI